MLAQLGPERGDVANVLDQLDTERFWREGYSVLRDVFSTDEVERWRAAALARRGSSADLLSDDALREIILHPAVLAVARTILGGEPVYFADSNFLIGDHGSGFHKDNTDRDDPHAPDWQVDRYPLVRFGIYTQVHDEGNPGGLDLRVGSHRYCDLTTGEHISPSVRPGDLVVWNMRLTHSGNSRILEFPRRRLTPNTRLSRAVERLGGGFFLKQPREDRLALFFSYGLAGPLLNRFLEGLKSRTYAVKSWQQSSWSNETRRRISEAGLSVIDMTGYTPKPEDGPVHAEHRPLPY